MRERPILFSAPMVRAILEGRKTQTRRMVKGAPTNPGSYVLGVHQGTWGIHADVERADGVWRGQCPCGQPGDRLWVRETYFGNHFLHPNEPEDERELHYRADGLPDFEGEEHDIRWHPSIHMPRWASRITLEVTAVRVERLQDISEADALAEGIHRIPIGDGYDDRFSATSRSWADAVEQHPDVQPTARAAFRDLWESINGDDSWSANPWVWVAEFKRVAA